jgi:hypothetical protein
MQKCLLALLPREAAEAERWIIGPGPEVCPAARLQLSRIHAPRSAFR